MEGYLVLPDTSVWIEHFKGKTDSIEKLFYDDAVTIVTHALVITELVLGGIQEDDVRFHQLDCQIKLKSIGDEEMIRFIFTEGLSGRGIGYVDCCLLASCAYGTAKMVTLDKRLATVADELGLLWRMVD